MNMVMTVMTTNTSIHIHTHMIMQTGISLMTMRTILTRDTSTITTTIIQHLRPRIR